MSFVMAQADSLASAARELDGAGSAIAAHNTAAATPTSGVVPAAAGEVFALHAQMYQEASAQAAAVYEVFTTALAISADSCAVTEAATAIVAG